MCPAAVGSVKSKISYDGLSLDLGFHGRKAGPKYESPMSQEERRDCIAFLRSMLQLSPQARKTAEELLQDAWLHTNYEYPEYESN